MNEHRIGRFAFNIAIAPLLVCAATLASVTLRQHLEVTPAIFYIVAIILCSWIGGLISGLLATILSTLAIDYFMVAPIHSIDSFREDAVQSLVFMAVASIVAYLTAARRAAVQALNEASRRKDEFLAVLAHELRTPLATLTNAAQVLRLDGSNPATLERQLAAIERQTGHMSVLLSDLLDVTRIARGKMHLERKRLDLREVAEEAIEQHQGACECFGHRMVYVRPAAPIEVQGDPTRLRQVISNLLANAVKYTDPGGCIELDLAVESAEGARQAVLRVRDSGIGISAELLPKIFNLYEQADTAICRSKGGLGIGLSLVKGLVAMHGGTIEAASNGPGCGSEFRLKLPLAEAVPPAKEIMYERPGAAA